MQPVRCFHIFAYNIKRAVALLGAKNLVRAMQE